MNIFSQFTHIAKKETIGRSNIRSLIKDMHTDVVDYRREKQTEDASAVSDEMTISRFASAYKTLQFTSLISFSFLIFMLAYVFVADEWMLKFTICAFLVISTLWHLSFVIRAYRARLIYADWEKRNRPLVVNFEEILDAIFHDPRVFVPFVLGLKPRSEGQYDRINNKKRVKKG